MGDEGFESMDVVVGASDDKEEDKAPEFEPLQIDAEPETPEEEEEAQRAELDDFARHACLVSKVLLAAVLVVLAVLVMKYNQQAASVKAADEAYFSQRALPKGKFRGNVALASTFDSIGLQLKFHPKHLKGPALAVGSVPLLDKTHGQ
jgi:hypothetical protein